MANDNPQSPKIKLRGGVHLYASQMVRLEKVLQTLQERIPARLILLSESSGQVVAMFGDYSHIDPIALGSLIAGDLAASQEIARLTGEYQDFQLILREGEHTHLVISEAGAIFIILVLFNKEVPLGWARKLILKCAQEISSISKDETPEGETNAPKPELSAEGLPGLYSDALDEIWKGS